MVESCPCMLDGCPSPMLCIVLPYQQEIQPSSPRWRPSCCLAAEQSQCSG